ncbi:MAG: sensor histidine kinase [Ilumatobacteraceae bacterium]
MVGVIWFIIGALTTMALGILFRRRLGNSAIKKAELTNVSETILSPIADQLRPAFDALPIGVVITDRNGGRSVHNCAGAAMTGIRHIDILVQEAVEELLITAITQGSIQKTVEIAGPPTKYFAIRVQPLDVGGAMATVEDVTQRVLTDTVRTDFVANLSHELKTPVGGIAALGDTMVEETDPTVVKRLAESIVIEAYRLSAIVDDLLDLSRIESGATMNWAPVNIADVIIEVVASSRYSAQRHQVDLILEQNPSAYVYGDRMQLVSAFLNLVENGIKYSEARSSLQIRSEVIGPDVQVSVIDQGIGIAAKDHERIFERFYRVDRARSRATGGTGLGLSIVRHVVTNHGGRIELVSEEGKGATFTVILPRLDDPV